MRVHLCRCSSATASDSISNAFSQNHNSNLNFAIRCKPVDRFHFPWLQAYFYESKLVYCPRIWVAWLARYASLGRFKPDHRVPKQYLRNSGQNVAVKKKNPMRGEKFLSGRFLQRLPRSLRNT